MGADFVFNSDDYEVCELPVDVLEDPCNMCALEDCASRGATTMPCFDLAVARGVIPEDYHKVAGGVSLFNRLYLKSRRGHSLSGSGTNPPEASATAVGPVEVVALADVGVSGCRCCWHTKDEAVYASMSCDCLERAKRAGINVRDNDIRSRVYLRKV